MNSPIPSLLCLPALAALVSPAFIFAQSAAPGGDVVALEAFEVTSQKRTQAVQDVPLSVTAYTGSTLESFGVYQYKDLAPFVPGFFVQEQSPNNPGINIRGVTTDSGDPRSETRVSIFQDGVSISRSRGSVVELFDMERVEVLKGPQGTLFGRGAEIGALSLIQNKARNASESYLTGGAGNYSSYEAEGMVNLPASDTLYTRFAFRVAHHDGTIDNVADGSTLNGKDTQAFRAGLRWQPSDRTTVDLILNAQIDNPPGTSFKSGAIAPAGGDTSPFTFAELNRGDELYIDRAVWGATLLVTSELTDAWTFSSITGWRAYDSFEQFDADGSYLPLLEFAEDATGDQFSQEFRFDFDSGGAFVGFVGAGYFHETGEQNVPYYGNEQYFWPFLSGTFRDGIIAAGIPAAVANAAIPAMNPFVAQTNLPATFAIFNNAAFGSLQGLAALAGAPLSSHLEDYTNFGETSAFDLFADGTYQLTDRFELSGGLRLTFEDITSGYEARNLSGTPGMVGFILGGGTNNVFTPTPKREVSDSNTGWVGRLVGRYEFTDRLSGYASASRGRRPDSITINATSETYLKEEVVWNYEIGLKGITANQRLTYGAALFYYDYTNFQTTIADPANLGRFISIDAGNATGQGLELTTQGVVSDTLQIFASYGYTDATFDDTGDNGQPQQYAGNAFRLTAKHTGALGLIWTLPVRDVGTFTVSPVYQYKSKHYFDDNNAQFNYALRQDAFSLVNLRAGWRSVSGRYEASLSVENVFDEEYLIDAGNTGGGFGIPTFIAGSPRLYRASATVRF